MQQSMVVRRALIGVLVLVALTAATACGDDDDDGGSATGATWASCRPRRW